MATLTIRKFDDGAYQRLGERAKRNNRSLEAEARVILESRERPIDEIIDELRKLRERTAKLHGPMEDSVALIRAIRDEE